MVKTFCAFVSLIFFGCADIATFDSFSNEKGKSKEEFLADSEKCEREKNKYSNKIQGRELGFRGQDTGYLGCMKLEGWGKKID